MFEVIEGRAADIIDPAFNLIYAVKTKYGDRLPLSECSWEAGAMYISAIADLGGDWGDGDKGVKAGKWIGIPFRLSTEVSTHDAELRHPTFGVLGTVTCPIEGRVN
jgi:hypothetical protein